MTLERWDDAYQNALTYSIYIVTTGLIINFGIYIYVVCYLCMRRSEWNIPEFIYWQLALSIITAALTGVQLIYIMMTKEDLMFCVLPF